MSAKRVFEFDEFTLDATDRLLYRAGVPARIPPKLLDTLILLVERRGSVVTKDEIMQSVWPDTVVEEGGLARNVSLLRKSLGEGEVSRYIDTIPKRGYRFIGEVREKTAVEESRPSVVGPPLKPSGRKIAVLTTAFILIAVLVAVFFWRRRSVPELRDTALTGRQMAAISLFRSGRSAGMCGCWRGRTTCASIRPTCL